ncbi:MAG TPA: hydrogenase maturation nickel metallochaperone HypA [Deltaproteobacteria bacterium]|jgi:hydrogenase nickel incorporation protein HypA/HybF|nr:hydrogenase maturation nickel metallochaperone HypA [Deltaproteobacteria bacterium]HOI08634.1 hydrogenase maturation nickel metallochaperone HypA [Deltaproteobacteria bacterium]
MHEMSLVSSMLDIVEEYAAQHSFGKVNVLKLSFGALSCIEPSALKLSFEVFSKDTRAEGARLEYVIHPATVHCLFCSRDLPVPEYPAVCPECSSNEVALVGGFEELRLEEMDVE